MSVISKAIRKSAEGEDCSLRLFGCNFDVTTTVLAHIGKTGGMGQKCDDFFAVYACSDCHDKIDGRKIPLESDGDLAINKLRALEETQRKLHNKGLLIVCD